MFHTALIRMAAAFVLLFASPAIAQNALTDIMTNKVIRIAIPTDFPPYGSVGTEMKPQGLDIDMAEHIGARLGVKVELVPVTSVNRIPYLLTKKVDLVISTLGKSPDREKVIDFTAAYSPFYQAVYRTRDLLIRGPMDLAGKIDRGNTRRNRRHGTDEDRPARHANPPLRGQLRHFVRVRFGSGAAHRDRCVGRKLHDQRAIRS